MFNGNSADRPQTVPYDHSTNPGRVSQIGRALLKKALALRRSGVEEDKLDIDGTIGAEVKVEEEDLPQLTLWGSGVLLVVATVLIAFTAEWLVSSINGLAESTGVSKEFIGLILIPIVGNAAEHASAVVASAKDKLTLSTSVAVGSSIVSSFLPFWHHIINSLPSSKSPCL